MKILLIGGRGMVAGGNSKYWMLAVMLRAVGHEVRVRECVETGSAEGKVTAEDVLWAEVIVGYSNGIASLWHLWHKLAAAGYTLALKLLVIVAGVPDTALGQFYLGLWHVPEFVGTAVCFDVNDIPASCTIQNAGAVDIDFGQPLSTARFNNVHCGNLFPVVMPIAAKHIGIVEKQEVIDAIASLIGAA
jgi:hypothetical protein